MTYKEYGLEAGIAQANLNKLEKILKKNKLFTDLDNQRILKIHEALNNYKELADKFKEISEEE